MTVELRTSVDAGGNGDLQGTINAAGQNSLIIATGGTLTGNVAIRRHQTLQGGGSTIQIRGRNTGAVVPFTAPARPPLTGASAKAMPASSRTLAISWAASVPVVDKLTSNRI